MTESKIKNSKKHFLRKPSWIRTPLSSNKTSSKLQSKLRHYNRITVCEEAACPNRAECFSCGIATFMIMGDVCTRNCSFCNVRHGKPKPLDPKEPNSLARIVSEMKLKYIVLTSVDRDDLEDGGANHYVSCMQAVRHHNPEIKIEILVPDFKECMENALQCFQSSPPDVFNHNIETVPRLYSSICPSANYDLSLMLLKKQKEYFPAIPTKSGLMLGLGETNNEVESVLHDLRIHHVDRLTLGQYLQPTRSHTSVERYVHPKEFDQFKRLAKEMGFSSVSSGPLVRSSYQAEKQAAE